jgi:integrase/recombinase XerC
MAPFFVLEDFKNYLLTEKRVSEHTITAYINDLNQFLNFTSITTISELKEVNHQLIRSWIVELIESNIDKRSVNRKLSTLRSFYKWAQKQSLVENNPMLKVQGPKQEKRLPSFAKQSEMSIEKTEAMFGQDFDGIRDHLIVEMFYQTGIRLSELIELKQKDVSLRNIKVLGKRNKERIIPITDGLNVLIQKYLAFKSQMGLDSIYFYVLQNGNKLYPKLVYRKINYYLGSVTSLDKKSPHVLRHTFATHMLNNGAGLETLKDLLGHANLSATQVYTHNSFAQLNNIYSQAHPRGHKKE